VSDGPGSDAIVVSAFVRAKLLRLTLLTLDAQVLVENADHDHAEPVDATRAERRSVRPTGSGRPLRPAPPVPEPIASNGQAPGSRLALARKISQQDG
jgi:hypothetical protein